MTHIFERINRILLTSFAGIIWVLAIVAVTNHYIDKSGIKYPRECMEYWLSYKTGSFEVSAHTMGLRYRCLERLR